jgi:hypothetical protein
VWQQIRQEEEWCQPDTDSEDEEDEEEEEE